MILSKVRNYIRSKVDRLVAPRNDKKNRTRNQDLEKRKIDYTIKLAGEWFYF